MLKTDYAAFAKPYIPANTKVLFIAESPPKSTDLYFYRPDVYAHDHLWIALVQAVYGDCFKEIRDERRHKNEWLTKFKNDGYRLIDALKNPILGKPSKSSIRKLIQSHSSELIEEIEDISPDHILLIKVTVYDALFESLREAKLSVVNQKPFHTSFNEFHADKFRISIQLNP